MDTASSRDRFERVGEELAGVRGRFVSPPFGHAPFHFWEWDGDMRPLEIRAQMAGMRANGIEEVMIFPTAGLELEYLGEEFFDRVEVACRCAAETGMRIWLYDELNWPSGVAGGAVLESHPEYGMRFLACYGRSVRVGPGDAGVPFRFEGGEVVLALARRVGFPDLDLGPQLARFARERREEQTRYFTSSRTRKVTYHEGTLELPPGDWEVRIAVNSATRVLLSAVLGTRWSRDVVGYLDTLNPAAVQEFLRVTHERYALAVGGYFGSVVQGIFTDEPTVSRPHGWQVPSGWTRASLPWSDALRTRLGTGAAEGLETFLAALLFGEARPERERFWRAVTDQYIESYHAPIRRWCHDHGLQYIGHLLGDDAPDGWVGNSGDLYRVLSELDVPGYDDVGPFPSLFVEDDRRPGPLPPAPASYFGLRSLLGGKVASSVARQHGSGDCLVEALAVQGYRIGLADARAACNWLAAIGANRLLIGSMPYSQKGASKCIEPSIHSYHSPWWPYYRFFAQYTRRLTFALSQGRPVAPVALCLPEAALRSPEEAGGAAAGLTALAKALFVRHIDWDYLSEEHALREEGLSRDGGSLRVGKGIYRAVVLPPLAHLPPRLVETLEAFRRSGGIVLALPTGWPDARDASVPAGTVLRSAAEGDLADELEEALGGLRPVRILEAEGEREADGIASQARAFEDGTLVFVANQTRSDRTILVRPLAPCACVEMWDPEDGSVGCLAQETTRGGPAARLTVAPGQGLFLALATSASAVPTAPVSRKATPASTAIEVPLPRQWRFRPHRPNAYPLHGWAVAADPAGPWSAVSDGAAAMEPAALGGLPWVRARFRLGHVPATLALVTERGVVEGLRLNGTPLAAGPATSSYFDESSDEWNIAGQAQPGENEVVARLAIPEGTWIAWYARPTLGCLFLTGDFAVEGETLIGQPASLALGSWADQGFPYYSGSGTYEQEIALSAAAVSGALRLSAQLWGGVLEVAANGTHVAVRPWAPYRVVLSCAVRPGRNTLSLTVTNTIANLMGEVLPSGLQSVRLGREGSD